MKKIIFYISVSALLFSCGAPSTVLPNIVSQGLLLMSSAQTAPCVEWVPIGTGITLPYTAQGTGIQYSIQPDTAGNKWVHLRGLIFGVAPITTDSVYVVLIDNLPTAIQSTSDWAWMSTGYIIHNSTYNPPPYSGIVGMAITNTDEIRMLRNPFYFTSGGWFVDLGNIKYPAR